MSKEAKERAKEFIKALERDYAETIRKLSEV